MVKVGELYKEKGYDGVVKIVAVASDNPFVQVMLDSGSVALKTREELEEWYERVD